MKESVVAILLCTYRGENFLRRQLESIVQQSHSDWIIFASDDNSDDATLSILRHFQNILGESRMRIYGGPARGFAANFLSLMGREEIQADHYAFTDQDDEWIPSKLERAVTALSTVPATTPALYGSRSELIDSEGRHLGLSPDFRKTPDFRNALVQNMVTGNTMVLNRAAMALIRSAGTDLQVSAHDWWTYLLVTGNGGRMLYDRMPTIRYRQHDRNLYGANTSLGAKWTRIVRLFNGDFGRWNGQNIAALRKSWMLLTEKNRASTELFEHARGAWALGRLVALWRARVYRQTWDGQLGLILATLTRRL